MSVSPTDRVERPAISVQGLEKSFNYLKVAVEAARGSIFTLLGSNGASAFTYPLILLPFISSAFAPTATMPRPVRAFAEHQPMTSIVNAIRDLFTQQRAGTDIWIALAWCVGILVVAYLLATKTYRRGIS